MFKKDYTQIFIYPYYTVHRILQSEYRSGQPFPSPGDPPDPGIEPGSPESQADSLPAEISGRPILMFKKDYTHFTLTHS